MEEQRPSALAENVLRFHTVGSSNGCDVPHKWSSPGVGKKIDLSKQIFCNRSLNMKNIIAVGFDMNYTLAQYKSETFEAVAYERTVRKLVNDLRYPNELLEWTFDRNYMVRGLVLDKKRGNILKMDRHNYVKIAYHGFTELSKKEKVDIYGRSLIQDSFDEPDYALIDTLFSLAEAYLFAQLVDFKDNKPEKIPKDVDYARMYRDVRAAVDLCHRDRTLKQMVAKEPNTYINEDTSIVPLLKMIRDSGRSTFLVTNSLWDYTNIVMNFLCGGRTVHGSHTCNFDWLQYFDVVITGSAKPGFFHEESRANLFEVDPQSGMLLNTDNGTPMPQVGDPSQKILLKGKHNGCRVFQGGNVGHLHNLLSIESSSQVFYVGHHIYGDILRSKKVLGWRTMLVVPELEKEVELLGELTDMRKHLILMRNDRDSVEDKIHHLNLYLKFEDVNENDKQEILSALKDLESKRDKVRPSHQQAHRECHQKFHEVWGQLMKTGYQSSRFAHQVERFACLYTSQVSNLRLYSPDKYYRPSEDFLSHEFHDYPPDCTHQKQQSAHSSSGSPSGSSTDTELPRAHSSSGSLSGSSTATEIPQLFFRHTIRNGPPPASQSAIDALKTVKVTEKNECVICMRELDIGSDALQMPCKHLFHRDCSLPWLELHSTCPVCRHELPTDDHEYEIGAGRMSVRNLFSLDELSRDLAESTANQQARNARRRSRGGGRGRGRRGG